MTIGVEYIALAAFVASAAGAYASYQGSRNQSEMGVQSALIRREQLSSEASAAALQARSQEEERQRRAGIAKSAGVAGAAAAGVDYWLSPTAQTLDAENDRIIMGDVSSIQLLGAAQQRKYALEGRGVAVSQEAYATMGSNAWVGPTASLIGAGAKAYGSMGPTGGSGDPGSMFAQGRAAL